MPACSKRPNEAGSCHGRDADMAALSASGTRIRDALSSQVASTAALLVLDP
jgi:hypothetical protein